MIKFFFRLQFFILMLMSMVHGINMLIGNTTHPEYLLPMIGIAVGFDMWARYAR